MEKLTVMEKELINEIDFGLFDFGHAIRLLKEGRLVARAGWNGKGMFIFMRPSDRITEESVLKIKSLPRNFKEWVESHPSEYGVIDFGSYLCMKAADGSIVNGWLASQTDMLADDWCEVDPYSK